MKTTRRHWLALAAGSTLLPGPSQAQAPFADRPIKLVVPYPPGAALDTVARIAARSLEPRLGQSVVIENRDGGGSQIGTAFVARARPDGLTWLVNAIDVFTLMPWVSAQQPYVVERDFTPLARLASVPYALHVHGALPIRTLGELIAQAKARPGELKYGSAGPGSLPRVAMEMLAAEAGIRLLHVPYRGMAAVTNDLIAGHIDAAVVSPATMAPHAAAGKVRTLCLTSSQRSPTWPQIPSTTDSGIRQVEAQLGIGWMGPAGVPQAMVDRLSRELAAVLQEPGVVKQLGDRGFDADFLPPSGFASHIRGEAERWKQVVAKLSIPTS